VFGRKNAWCEKEGDEGCEGEESESRAGVGVEIAWMKAIGACPDQRDRKWLSGRLRIFSEGEAGLEVPRE